MASTTLEERIDIHESAEKGEASCRTARRLPWRQRTVQKWRRLLFANQAGDPIASAPIKGISKAQLMGDIADLSLFPAFQMTLPFDWEQRQNARLYETRHL